MRVSFLRGDMCPEMVVSRQYWTKTDIRLLGQLERLVALGSWPLTLPPDDRWIAEWVVGLATASLHEYDFVAGTRALR